MTREPWNEFGTPTEPKPTAARTVLILMGLSAALIAAVLIIWSVQKARAHSFYEMRCCSGSLDCRPVPDGAISETPTGYRINATGEVVPYNDTRIRQSPDQQFHWCSVAGEPDSRTLCIYSPGRGS